MSRAARSGAFITMIAGVVLASCARPSMDPEVGPHILADAKAPVHINFTCDGGVNNISLTDRVGLPAWTFSAGKNDLVSWEVPVNVAINAIASKSAIALPITITEAHGGNGNPIKGQLNSSAESGHHHLYYIDVSCTPTAGNRTPVRLVIDPEMIIL